ncbi:hypothetical protein [Methylosinus sp. LW4]|uniref:hypothetical protein n=1 Tax=Methylosinus sp. LW4 TaxID=136993 RepID=UPI000371101D|nr:hypothetical protein [Methylosinus sp. LW4]
MSLAALCFALQAFAAIGGGRSPHSMTTELGASTPSVACVAQKSDAHRRAPGHDEPLCCLFFGACDRNCDAAPPAFDLLHASLAGSPAFDAPRGGVWPPVDKRSGRPSGWASSWSPRAPPLFS